MPAGTHASPARVLTQVCGEKRVEGSDCAVKNECLHDEVCLHLYAHLRACPSCVCVWVCVRAYMRTCVILRKLKDVDN